MPKIGYLTSNLKINNSPSIKKYQRDNPKLGLINKKKLKNITFRLPIDAIDDIKAVSKEISEMMNMNITQTNFVEIVARHLRKNPTKLMKMIKA